jgi:hypothetical protein
MAKKKSKRNFEITYTLTTEHVYEVEAESEEEVHRMWDACEIGPMSKHPKPESVFDLDDDLEIVEVK